MNAERRPDGTEAALVDLAGGLGSETESTGTPPTSPDPHEPAAAVFFRNCYAVLVRGKSVRRHLYFNLPAAERTVKRALARGDRAELVLVKLVPVDARHLDEGGEQ